MHKITFDRRVAIYYDINQKIIGRNPTQSNLKENGSDNSLYMGLNNNRESINIIKNVLGINNIDEFNNKKYNMSFYGEEIDVESNINANGQLQFKIVGNGQMYRMLKKYKKNTTKKVEPNNLLIFLDFDNNEIFFSTEEQINDDEQTNINVSIKELEEFVEEAKELVDPEIDIDAYVETNMNVRNNYVQRNFKKNLFVEFDGKCALCNINKKELLIASHILPYSKCPSVKEMIDYNNGLLLCINHDSLFDKGYISFDYKDGSIKISSEIDKSMYSILNINEKMRLNKKYLTNKRIQYLVTHKIK